MVKKILCFICLICSSAFAVEPISNPAIVTFKQSHDDIYRAFLRETQFLKGSVYPIRLVLFPEGSEKQRELSSFLKIPASMYEIEMQKASNLSAQPRRVNTDEKMIEAVSQYIGSLGYLTDSEKVIFNNGGQVVIVEIK
jgi:hypothetical protein